MPIFLLVPRATLVANNRVFIGFVNRLRGRRSSTKLLHVSVRSSVANAGKPTPLLSRPRSFTPLTSLSPDALVSTTSVMHERRAISSTTSAFNAARCLHPRQHPTVHCSSSSFAAHPSCRFLSISKCSSISHPYIGHCSCRAGMFPWLQRDLWLDSQLRRSRHLRFKCRQACLRVLYCRRILSRLRLQIILFSFVRVQPSPSSC
jgi:hypothetical protein